MILTAHQPVYIPWIGLFHKIALADQFCIFDRVQYQTKDFNNRNKIKTQAGDIWLSVPVESKNHFNTLICDIKIVQNNWRKKHLKSIKLAYQKSPYFELYYPEIESIILRNHLFLSELNHDILMLMLKWFDIKCRIVRASDYNFQGNKSELVLDMCKTLGADSYIFGAQGKDYADVNQFSQENIKIYFQEYNHPSYSQLHGEFKPYMSALDLLFNVGEQAKIILFKNNITTILRN